MSEPGDRPAVGLRERKKAKTRAVIQAAGLRLFREQGYDATTVQQIIEAAEVSESTFFRYFPTKGDVVLSDDYDPLIVQAFLGQPPELSPIAAFRAAFRAVFSGLSDQELSEQRERMQLIFSVPELRAGMLDQFAAAMRLLAEVIAERTGRKPEELPVLALAGAVVGAVVAVTFATVEDPTTNLADLVDQALAHLEAWPAL